jgi:hypothetical protein
MRFLLIFLMLMQVKAEKKTKEEAELNKVLSEALSELNVERQKQNLGAVKTIVTHQFCLPVELQKIKKIMRNGKLLELELKETAKLHSMHDGQIVFVSSGLIKIRHVIDGGIVVISAIQCHEMSCLLKEGDIVLKKQTIGYAKNNVTVIFYNEDGEIQDYSDYIAPNCNKTKSKMKINV